jgi:ELWxxDGT repeat protein
VGGVLFFAANGGYDGRQLARQPNDRQLWRTDGTPDGTYLVTTIGPPGAGADPDNLVAFNGLVYFTADDRTHGRELWASDGTSQGTYLVEDINPGSGSAFWSFYDPHLTGVGNQLFFVADDRVHGRELWVYTPDQSAARRSLPGGDRAALATASTAPSLSQDEYTARIDIGFPPPIAPDGLGYRALAIQGTLADQHFAAGPADSGPLALASAVDDPPIIIGDLKDPLSPVPTKGDGNLER